MLNFFKNHKLTKLGGLNNSNYLLDYYNNLYVLRIPSKDNKNDFSNENKILSLVNSTKLSPHIIYHNKDNGILLTNFFENSNLNIEKLNSLKFLNKFSSSLNKLHSLQCSNTFNPFNAIRENFSYLIKIDYKFSHDIYKYLNTLDSLELELKKDPLIRLCHNDLNLSNILYNGNELKFIDFEFSGMNDAFFDLATISWFLDENFRKILLKSYFGFYKDSLLKKLHNYLYVVKLWNASWSFRKSLTSTSDYDYVLGANMILDDLKKDIFV